MNTEFKLISRFIWTDFVHVSDTRQGNWQSTKSGNPTKQFLDVKMLLRNWHFDRWALRFEGMRASVSGTFHSWIPCWSMIPTCNTDITSLSLMLVWFTSKIVFIILNFWAHVFLSWPFMGMCICCWNCNF